MAVVQWIARVTLAELEACRTDENVLDELISFDLRPDEDYLDLDWSPSGLKLYFVQSKQLPVVQQALALATGGARIVNLNCVEEGRYYDVVKGDWVYSHITELNPDEVRTVAQNFDLIDMNTFINWLPADAAAAQAILKEYDQSPFVEGYHPTNYFREYLGQLVEFYKAAAQQNMATVMWWD